jgi:hypothetical protein
VRRVQERKAALVFTIFKKIINPPSDYDPYLDYAIRMKHLEMDIENKMSLMGLREKKELGAE